MKRYRVSKETGNDLDKIFAYWAERASLDIADRLIDAIVERFWLLGEYPESARECDDIQPGTRCFPAGKYLTLLPKDAPWGRNCACFSCCERSAGGMERQQRVAPLQTRADVSRRQSALRDGLRLAERLARSREIEAAMGRRGFHRRQQEVHAVDLGVQTGKLVVE